MSERAGGSCIRFGTNREFVDFIGESKPCLIQGKNGQAA